jgi:phospholipase/lecithinase/hemolysin
MVVFGDSLSDGGLDNFNPDKMGSLASTDGEVPPATCKDSKCYNRGKWTDANTWCEYAANVMEVPLYNYATGGATTGAIQGSVSELNGSTIPLPVKSSLKMDGRIPVPGVDKQVDQFIKDFTDGKGKDIDLTSSIVVIFAGGNDFFFGLLEEFQNILDAATNSPTSFPGLFAGIFKSLRDRMANKIAESIAKLAEFFKTKKWGPVDALVIGLPDLSETPIVKQLLAQFLPSLGESNVNVMLGALNREQRSWNNGLGDIITRAPPAKSADLDKVNQAACCNTLANFFTDLIWECTALGQSSSYNELTPTCAADGIKKCDAAIEVDFGVPNFSEGGCVVYTQIDGTDSCGDANEGTECKGIKQHTSADFRFGTWDLSSAMSVSLGISASLGVTDNEKPCGSGFQNAFCEDPKAKNFFDEIHPSSTIHRAIGRAFYAYLLDGIWTVGDNCAITGTPPKVDDIVGLPVAVTSTKTASATQMITKISTRMSTVTRTITASAPDICVSGLYKMSSKKVFRGQAAAVCTGLGGTLATQTGCVKGKACTNSLLFAALDKCQITSAWSNGHLLAKVNGQWTLAKSEIGTAAVLCK